MKIFPTLYKLRFSLSKSYLEGRIATTRHKHHQIHACLARLCPKVQKNWRPFYEISFLYTQTVMPARWDVCNKLYETSIFWKSTMGVRTGNRRTLMKKKLLTGFLCQVVKNLPCYARDMVWSLIGKIPRATEQLSWCAPQLLWAGALERMCCSCWCLAAHLGPMLHDRRSHCNKKPRHN